MIHELQQRMGDSTTRDEAERFAIILQHHGFEITDRGDILKDEVEIPDDQFFCLLNENIGFVTQGYR